MPWVQGPLKSVFKVKYYLTSNYQNFAKLALELEKSMFIRII